jgi:flagellar hook-basal body complex protein FliE
MIPPAISSILGAVSGTGGVQAEAALRSSLSTSAVPSFGVPITSPPEVNLVPATASPSVAGIAEPTSWGQMAHRVVENVNQQQVTAGEKVLDTLRGGPTPVHEAMIAVEEANLSFMVLSEMRNKVIETYQEMMRMQV